MATQWPLKVVYSCYNAFFEGEYEWYAAMFSYLLLGVETRIAWKIRIARYMFSYLLLGLRN